MHPSHCVHALGITDSLLPDADVSPDVDLSSENSPVASSPVKDTDLVPDF